MRAALFVGGLAVGAAVAYLIVKRVKQNEPA